MRKSAGILAGLICCILCVMEAKADVIWEPEDSFYQKHAEECTYVNRQYRADGPDGVVIVYRSPESPEVIDVWENGYQVSIVFTCEDSDGIVWGIYDDYQGKCGWMPMDYMEVVYDSISFAEEYAGEIVSQSGSLDEKYRGEDIFFWEYPGSESCELVTVEEYMPDYNRVYTDENGNSWGNVGYYYGLRNMWVCLAQPGADYGVLYPEGTPQRGTEKESPVSEPQKSEAEQSAGRIVPKMKRGVAAAAVLMVLLTVAVTAVLLVLLKRRNKSDTPPRNKSC